MVKVMYNDQLVYKVVIWAFFEISLRTEKVAIALTSIHVYAVSVCIKHIYLFFNLVLYYNKLLSYN